MHSSSGVTGLVLSYRLFYFLLTSRMLAGAAEPVSVVILVYSARDFYRGNTLFLFKL